jgi:acetyl-CoA carboxylase carboxyl transferase subunit alpha
MEKHPEKYLLEFEKPMLELYKKLEHLHHLSSTGKMDMAEEIKLMEKRIENTRKDLYSKLSPIQIVQVARHILRPTTLDWISMIFTDFMELHGDRNFGDDSGMIGGIAKFDGEPCVVLGHQKGHSTKELLARNFGMAMPEGYRKALRLMRMADRFKRPIFAFIDTPGAYPGIGAEERGQAEAIAKNLRSMAELGVPFICVITGEGGSGGALGIGMGNRVLMMEYSVYSVISPEGCASILFRDAKKANEAGTAMKITAKDQLELGVIEEIVKEPIGAAHNNPQEAANNLKAVFKKHLEELKSYSSREIIANRYQKYRHLGVYKEI